MMMEGLVSKEEGVRLMQRQPCPEERKRKIGAANKGRKFPNRILSEKHKQSLSKPKSELARRNISKAKQGKKNPMYGVAPWNKGITYKNPKSSISKKGKPWSEKRRLAYEKKYAIN